MAKFDNLNRRAATNGWRKNGKLFGKWDWIHSGAAAREGVSIKRWICCSQGSS